MARTNNGNGQTQPRDDGSPIFIGLMEAFGEDLIDGVAAVLKNTAGGIAQIEIVRNGLVKLLSHMSATELAMFSGALKVIFRLTQARGKAWLKAKLTAKGVPAPMVDIYVDALDDFGEALTRNTTEALTPENVSAFVNKSIAVTAAKHGIAPPAAGNVAPNPTNPAPPAAPGGPMPIPLAGGHPAPAPAAGAAHAPPAAPPADTGIPKEVATAFAAMGVIGKHRMGALWAMRHESINADGPNELAGASTIGEAISALCKANARAAALMLDDPDFPVHADVRKDQAVRLFLGTAEMYLTNPSKRAQARDLLDRLLDGKSKKAVYAGLRKLIGTTVAFGKGAIYAMVGLGALGFVLVVVGVGIVGWGMFVSTDVAGKHIIDLSLLGIGGVIGLVGCGSFAAGNVIWLGIRSSLMWAYGAAGEPIHYLKTVVKTIAQGFGIHIEEPAEAA